MLPQVDTPRRPASGFEYGAALARHTFIIDEILPVATCLQFLNDLSGIIHDLITWREKTPPSCRSLNGELHSLPLGHNGVLCFLLAGFHGGDAEAG